MHVDLEACIPSTQCCLEAAVSNCQVWINDHGSGKINQGTWYAPNRDETLVALCAVPVSTT